MGNTIVKIIGNAINNSTDYFTAYNNIKYHYRHYVFYIQLVVERINSIEFDNNLKYILFFGILKIILITYTYNFF